MPAWAKHYYADCEQALGRAALAANDAPQCTPTLNAVFDELDQLVEACDQGAENACDALTREQFGPVLHIVRFKARELDKVINDINGRGYGLTFGVHSRNESFAAEIAQKIRVGNVYINRNIIGAVVGVQPFGGQGLSGTGPKAGGPHYLLRLANEKTISVNTAAVGGNTKLLTDD